MVRVKSFVCFACGSRRMVFRGVMGRSADSCVGFMNLRMHQRGYACSVLLADEEPE